MVNLLQETKDVLSEHEKTIDDIIYVQCSEYMIPIDNFLRLANINYDNGKGGQEVGKDLTIHGIDFIMIRDEYDGAEWWRYISTCPVKEIKSIEALIRSQAREREIVKEQNVYFLSGCKIADFNRDDYFEYECI